ncbi:TolC family protein [Desulfobulbus rhabdoformis]|uniref:TolC family protein n=1 Tax=Desulfobulbus rhabdoformis TaxID=34032 RepID=UPI001964DE89|nr:TolC family protein [Desulfobulbus rhabdoformis]MBM9613703.1 TolC family protein [Desulfobulbus rhabdoformis]
MHRIILTLFFVSTCLSIHLGFAQVEPRSPDLSQLTILTMRTAQEVALSKNPNMAAARTRIEQARARVRQATAAWWPSLDLSAGAARQRLSNNQHAYNQLLSQRLGPTASTDQNLENYSAGLQATWVLFDGFYRNFREKQASFDENSNRAAMADSQRLLINSVAEAFLNAQLAQTKIDIAQADKTFYLRQLEDAQNRFDVGAGPWGDVLNIKVQVNSAKTSLIGAQREFEAAGYGLAALMGIDDAALPSQLRLQSLDKQCPIKSNTEEVSTLITEALAQRPDIRQLEAMVKQADAAQGMAKAPLYPKVQIAGALEGEREGDSGLDSNDFGHTLGINMSWNLYAGGADKARMIETEQAKREAIYTLAGLRNSVAAEIRQDLALLQAAEEQVRLQRETVKLVQENRDLAKNEYEAGEASLVRLNEAQRDLTATHGRYAQALVSYQLQRQRLQAATGRNLANLTLSSK